MKGYNLRKYLVVVDQSDGSYATAMDVTDYSPRNLDKLEDGLYHKVNFDRFYVTTMPQEPTGGETMSRVELQPINPEHEVVVGLDRPLSTFFITVTVRQADDDLRDIPPVVFRDHWRIADVVENIERFAADTPKRTAVVEAILLDLDPADAVLPVGAILEEGPQYEKAAKQGLPTPGTESETP